jgi:hypothetical protein
VVRFQVGSISDDELFDKEIRSLETGIKKFWKNLSHLKAILVILEKGVKVN